MPTTLTVLDPTIGEVSVQYKEPYVTAGLNRKFAGVVPRGIHRGFKLAPNGANNTVTIKADPLASDHVAQYVTTDGYSLTIRRVGGDFSLALTADQTFVIAIYATYSVGATTTGEIRAYTLTEYNALLTPARNELIVLGTVITSSFVPVITRDRITHDRRTWGVNDLGTDVVPWIPLHADPSFETLTTGDVTAAQVNVWTLSSGSLSLGKFVVTTTDPTGEKAVTYTQISSGSPNSIEVAQYVFAPVAEAQTVRCRLKFKNLQASTAGTLIIQPKFQGLSGSVAAISTYTLDITTVNSNYVDIDLTFPVPEGANSLVCVGIETSVPLTWTSNADAFRINDFQVWLEPVAAFAAGLGTWAGAHKLVSSYLRLAPPTGTTLSGADPVLSSTGTDLQLRRADGAATEGSFDIYQAIRNLGAGLASELTPRLESPIATSGTYTLLWDNATSGNKGFRVYAKTVSTPSLDFVFGARWDGTNWNSSGNGSGNLAWRLTLDAQGLRVRRSPFGTSWNDSSWNTAQQIVGNSGGITDALSYFSQFIDTQANAISARIHMEGTNDGFVPRRTLLLRTGNFSSADPQAIRIYSSEITSGATRLEITRGVYWSTSDSKWYRDSVVASAPVTKWELSGTDVKFYAHATSAASFDDTAWFARSVGALGSAAAWGSILCDTPNPLVQGTSNNVGTPSYLIAPGKIVVPFSTTLAVAPVVVAYLSMPAGSTSGHWNLTWTTTTTGVTFKAQSYSPSGGAYTATDVSSFIGTNVVVNFVAYSAITA